jgi:hypothetical protein
MEPMISRSLLQTRNSDRSCQKCKTRKDEREIVQESWEFQAFLDTFFCSLRCENPAPHFRVAGSTPATWLHASNARQARLALHSTINTLLLPLHHWQKYHPALIPYDISQHAPHTLHDVPTIARSVCVRVVQRGLRQLRELRYGNGCGRVFHRELYIGNYPRRNLQ